MCRALPRCLLCMGLWARASLTFQYADDAAMTQNVVTLPGDDFGLPFGLVTGAFGTLKVTGNIPANKYARISAASVFGSPTIGALGAQETQW